MNDDSNWFKDAVIYELHVRSFCDGTGDGIGDFRGLRERLGYFEELGVTALWLLPFYPSPLRDDGYDIADYLSVHPDYGTMEDFQAFLAEAHRRGLRVITELVINHTSDQHPWFQRARRAPAGSSERDFYVWSDTPRRYEEARIIFQDFESSNWAWDGVAGAYYWHRFYSHQPDLNFENPAVTAAVLATMDFWFQLGVDGMRLDAVPYLFERDGTSCENLPETHAFLRELRRHIDERYPGKMLLAEANQWPEDAAAYFGRGDECHMAFHFPLMPRIFMALQMEDRFPVVDILEQTPTIPENCQWAIFLRNHDELTLEMVTDEERDYMVRIYAEDARARINLGIRRRLAPLLGNNRRRIELIHSLLFSLPGTPILYYGDEIGMGDNIYLGDRNGVRTPMQWSADRNAGFSRANPQQLFLPVIIDPEFHYETVNVDLQQKNLSSLYWWTRRMIAVRRAHAPFAQGTLEFLPSDNAKVLAYVRRLGDDVRLVVANLSRFSQAVPIDLSAFRGAEMQELFGNTRFPVVGDQPVLFTLGPHGYYWLSLVRPAGESPGEGESQPQQLEAVAPEWGMALRRVLERTILPRYLPTCRWFGGKQRRLREVRVAAEITGEDPQDPLRILLLEVHFTEGGILRHVLPLWIGAEPAGGDFEKLTVVARFASGEVLCDGLGIPAVRARLIRLMIEEGRWSGASGILRGMISPEVVGELTDLEASRLIGGEQSNTSMAFGDRWMMKFLRQFEAGPHPDAQILRALGEAGFPHVPRYGGEIRISGGGQEGVVALLSSFVPNQGDGWTYATDAVARFFERVMIHPSPDRIDGEAEDVVGGNFPERMRQLGQRTGELHVCLAGLGGGDFRPEALTTLGQRSIYQGFRNLSRRTELELASRAKAMSPEMQAEIGGWSTRGSERLKLYGGLLGRKLAAQKIRVHGDYHLGQVLNTGKDFVILDFEGEPLRSLGERLLKRLPFVDLAGMIRSVDYAMQSGLRQQRPEDQAMLGPWGEAWRRSISRAFLQGYIEATPDASFLPRDAHDFALLLRVCLLDKAIYEIGYEMSYRPDWLPVPLKASLRILEQDEETPMIAELLARGAAD